MVPTPPEDRTIPENHDSVITISLLDPVRGDAVQSWEFNGSSAIRFGRAETNHVVLGDAEVSRQHGELTRTEGQWSVTPLGRNGIAISGQPINGVTPVGPETVLRLAASGPYLEFRLGRRLNTHAERLADQQCWAARDREEKQSRATRTDVTDVDFLNRRNPQKPAS
jgi:pSer/pThr/pTyr-binding forkhead associated (FHA) protein